MSDKKSGGAVAVLLNPVFTEREGSPTPIWETQQFLDDLEAGDAEATRIAQWLVEAKGRLDVRAGYRFPASNLGNRQVDMTEEFNGRPRYTPIDQVDPSKGLIAKIKVERTYPHMDIASMGYDEAKRKFYALTWCTGCGDYGRRVYTSDAFQVHTCLICSALVKAEK